MPRTANPDKKDGKVYKSVKKAIAEYEAKKPVDKIIIRVPAGAREKIQRYVEQKAAEEPTNRKYVTDKGRPSVNGLIKSLLEDELGESLD